LQVFKIGVTCTIIKKQRSQSKSKVMQSVTRIEAIRVLAWDAKLGETVATKIVNKCEGVLVKECCPYLWLGADVVVYVETTDGRSWESVFNKRGSFRYNRKFKKNEA
jgi:hypothetical protein